LKVCIDVNDRCVCCRGSNVAATMFLLLSETFVSGSTRSQTLLMSGEKKQEGTAAAEGAVNHCSICLEEIGWIYPQKPNIGSMCIECAKTWDSKQKSEGKKAKDPATCKDLERCPYCEELLSAFTWTFHYSACAVAPEDVRSKRGKDKQFIFNEAERNRMSRERWQEYVALMSVTRQNEALNAN
jgi:hypothetical protein